MEYQRAPGDVPEPTELDGVSSLDRLNREASSLHVETGVATVYVFLWFDAVLNKYG